MNVFWSLWRCQEHVAPGCQLPLVATGEGMCGRATCPISLHPPGTLPLLPSPQPSQPALCPSSVPTLPTLSPSAGIHIIPHIHYFLVLTSPSLLVYLRLTLTELLLYMHRGLEVYLLVLGFSGPVGVPVI